MNYFPHLLKLTKNDRMHYVTLLGYIFIYFECFDSVDQTREIFLVLAFKIHLQPIAAFEALMCTGSVILSFCVSCILLLSMQSR